MKKIQVLWTCTVWHVHALMYAWIWKWRTHVLFWSTLQELNSVGIRFKISSRKLFGCLSCSVAAFTCPDLSGLIHFSKKKKLPPFPVPFCAIDALCKSPLIHISSSFQLQLSHFYGGGVPYSTYHICHYHWSNNVLTWVYSTHVPHILSSCFAEKTHPECTITCLLEGS